MSALPNVAHVRAMKRPKWLVMTGSLFDCDFSNEHCHPEINKDERPEIQHLAQSYEVGCGFVCRNLSGHSHDECQQCSRSNSGNCCLHRGHEAEEVDASAEKIKDKKGNDKYDERYSVGRPEE